MALVKVRFWKRTVYWTEHSGEKDLCDFHGIVLRRWNRELMREFARVLRRAPKKHGSKGHVAHQIFKHPEVSCVFW